MKASQTPLFTSKETPKDAQIKSHQLLIKGGYIHKQASGLYSYLPFGYIVHQKVEQIIREEMNKFGGVEVKLPILTQAESWEISGRWSNMGIEMIRLKDRHKNNYCLAPTHEEVITQVAKAYLKSYKQLPINFYQIGIKYRDEVRPRYGLIRCREFVMKDAYSFHATEESLDETYQKMRLCYHSIFERCGISVVSVQADSASMGGSYSEEFMVISQIGESTLLLAENTKRCPYHANQEKTEFIPAQKYPVVKSSSLPKLVDTPHVTSVKDVAQLIKKEDAQFIKAIIFEEDAHIIITFIPGNRELSLTKLKNITGLVNLEMATHATIEEGLQLVPGFVGPHKLPVTHDQEVILSSLKVSIKKKVLLYYDRCLKERGELVGGGNQKDSHYINLQEGRDFIIHDASEAIDLVEAEAGDLCPLDTQQKLVEKKGIELGHIFKIGRKYSDKMKFTVLDPNGKTIVPAMGCYGIGVGRTMQAFVEQNYDDHGMVWSRSLTPYDIYLIPIYDTEAELKQHEGVYNSLKEAGFSVYFDDRKERVGVKFHDADLVGFPWQIISGKKFLQSKQFELKNRKNMQRKDVTFDELITNYLLPWVKNS